MFAITKIIMVLAVGLMFIYPPTRITAFVMMLALAFLPEAGIQTHNAICISIYGVITIIMIVEELKKKRKQSKETG